jgi:hypothetical protein
MVAKPTKSDRNRVRELRSILREHEVSTGDINELRELLEAQGWFEEYNDTVAIRSARNAEIRRTIKGLKNDKNASEWASVLVEGPGGKSKRVYHQLEFCSFQQLRFVVRSHMSAAKSHVRKAAEVASFKEEYKQALLPLTNPSNLLRDEEEDEREAG